MGRGGLRRGAITAALAAFGAAVATGCSATDVSTTSGTNVVNGKALFVAKCGTCHTLTRAGTRGVTGPNLDRAFAQARTDGFGESTFAGVVEGQIRHPNRNAQVDPKTGKILPLMKANIVKGDDVRDVAAYVSMAAARPGKDQGLLATVGEKKAEGNAAEENGTIDIPTASAGLAFRFATGSGKAGTLKLESQNPQQTPHNIAIEGNGVDAKGKIVQGGATSEVTVDLKPGQYTFYCSVQGHRQAGMVGKITIK
jgi:plastocyanin